MNKKRISLYVYSHFSLCFMTIFHYIMSHTIYYKVFFLLILFYTFFSSSLLSQTFFCVYHLLRKYHLKAKKGYVPLERSLNVSCTKKKLFHYFIFCRLSIVFVVQEEKFFASAVIRWGWHTVAGFVWIPFDPRTRKWNT